MTNENWRISPAAPLPLGEMMEHACSNFLELLKQLEPGCYIDILLDGTPLIGSLPYSSSDGSRCHFLHKMFVFKFLSQFSKVQTKTESK